VSDCRVVLIRVRSAADLPACVAILRHPACGVAGRFVDPAGPGRGTGRLLLDGATTYAAAHDLPPVLDVPDDARDAIAVYERAGWRLAGAGADYLGEVLTAKVTPAAVELYRELCSKAALTREYQRGSHGSEVEVRPG
jgi:GNAT superfamily N-acetyltransferase